VSSTWGNLDTAARAVLRGRTVRSVSDDELSLRIPLDDEGRPRFRVFGSQAFPRVDEAPAGDKDAPGPPPPAEVRLIDPEDFDYELEITAEDTAFAEPIDRMIAPLADYFARDPGLDDGEDAPAPDATLPPIVDHRPMQSSIKQQGARRTCVSHASLALLEAATHIPDDLSEQYTHYKFNEFKGRPQDRDSSLKTTDAPALLARDDGRICLETEWPYISDQEPINAAVAAGTYQPLPSAIADETYGYRAYKVVGDAGLEGESIKNTRFLESLLALGLDVVIGTWVSWEDENNRLVLRPLLDPRGEPIGRGGHAMLIVGYDRPNQYFTMKNSWGTGWGHAGYGYFHYDFVRSCLKYGFTVSEVAPPAPTPG
jgi:Papain family cysteine protease